MPSESVDLIMTPRGVGQNWLPCGWCGYENGVINDMASFVKNEETGNAMVEMFTEAGIISELDTRRGNEGRWQVKIGACNEHLPSLYLLQYMAMHGDRILSTTKVSFTIPGVNK